MHNDQDRNGKCARMSERACCERVHDGGRMVSLHGCTKPAKVEREGRWYCIIHDPLRVAKKDAERAAKYEAGMVVMRKRWALEEAAEDLLAACEEALLWINGSDEAYTESETYMKITEKLRAAINKANPNTTT